MNNLALLGILIIVMWLAAYGYYVYVSRQQDEIAEDIERLEALLDQSEEEAPTGGD